jgi:hypothetical protein
MMETYHPGCPGKAGLVALTLVALAACSNITPMKEVRPEPNFIAAAIEPDHEVRIETVDGRELEFVVAEVESDALVSSDGERIYFEDIHAISFRSWEDPAHPCGGGQPVGCSMPELIGEIGYYKEYRNKFHKSCEQHDYCYRHGQTTYGLDQQDCDDRFYTDMLGQCGPAGGILGLLEAAGDVTEPAKCRLAADQFYAAVQRYGAKAFRTTTSTYCAYDGARKPK